MDLGQDLFRSTPLEDKERKLLIESYPPIDGLDYQPPEAIPSAYTAMSDYQRSYDGSLKSSQYLLSAVFRPLDVLTRELLLDEVPQSTKYCRMIYDIRSLLLHANSTLNHYRTNLAYKAINRDFRLPSNEQKFTVPVEVFNSTIDQLHSANKSIREAKQFGNKKKKGPFRSGPPSQHGGSNFNKVFNTQQSGDKSQQQQQPRQNQQQQQPLQQEVGGRLSQYHQQWHLVTNSYWLIHTIKNGYKIPFTHAPPLSNHPTPIRPFDQQQHQLFDQAIQELYQQKAIQEVQDDTPGFYSPITPKIQIGNIKRSVFTNPKGRLSHIDRSSFCFSSHPGTPILSQVPSFPLEQQILGVYNDTFRTKSSSVAVHQDSPTSFGMGTTSGHSYQRLLRRSNLYSQLSSTGEGTYNYDCPEASVSRMDNQLREVSNSPLSTTGTFGLQTGHDDSTSTSSKTKDKRFEEVAQTGVEKSDSNPSSSSQFVS
ncbi:unnamed protein product [Mucor hiemalis]